MNRQVTLADNLVTHSFGDETVILDMSSEKYFTLNGIGALIWEMLAKGTSIEEAMRLLRDEYEVEDSVLQADVEAFVESLRKLALIQVRES